MTMKYISHRGNLMGPFPELENRPEYILNALNSGFECECDVWYADHAWWLGHDNPKYEINYLFLFTPGLWIHAKNMEALEGLKHTNLNYFWHENDKYTITSRGYIWAYPGSRISEQIICVMPENADPPYTGEQLQSALGICSDYVLIQKLK